MEKLFIEPSEYTPEVNFDPAMGTYTIIGKCLPEDAFEFFDPIFSWADEFKKENASAEIHITLYYFNTAASKTLLETLKRLNGSEGDLKINWYYYEDDEDLLEYGEYLQTILKEGVVKIIELEE